ncbi:unnamed protein product [Arabis nemorensis]|uniref:Uncharacterized protein n=1 Tax=Arabis nemorensis TaxID=586526 RepID=A0A565C126_9BRAS|nr:unnamed protein product [Arabis nemorensis]
MVLNGKQLYTSYLDSTNTSFPQQRRVNPQGPRTHTSPPVPSFVPETQPGHHPPQPHDENDEENDEKNDEENAEGVTPEEAQRFQCMTLEELLVSPARKKLRRLTPYPTGKALWVPLERLLGRLLSGTSKCLTRVGKRSLKRRGVGGIKLSCNDTIGTINYEINILVRERFDEKAKKYLADQLPTSKVTSGKCSAARRTKGDGVEMSKHVSGQLSFEEQAF